MARLRYAASIMCANLARLDDDLKQLERAGCDELHFDVMDGVFVPNFTLGFDFIKAARGCCSIPCCAHLMVVKPEPYIERFAEAGCSSITVHVETCAHIVRTLSQIRDAGVAPGVAINPGTPLTKLEYVLDCVERVLLMTVDPGHAGQMIINTAFERARILKENIASRGLRVAIEADGNINVENAAALARYGADIFVLGSSSIFNGRGNPGEALAAFKSSVERTMRMV